MANSAIVGVLRALLVADTAQFDKALERSKDTAKVWARELDKVGAQATKIGEALTAGLTLPLAALGAGAAKLATDFESSFAGVRKTVDASEAEFAQMATAFRSLSKEIPINVNELARLGEAAGALSVPKDQIVDFARVMAELGVTTNVTSDQAAESIAKIQTVFQATGKDTERFASTLVDLGNKGASTERDILEMAGRIASAGRAIGLSQAQVLGFASALANVGIEAEAGGTAISKVFSDISKAVSLGSKDLEAFAKVAGTSSEAFASLFKRDAAAAITQFVEGLGGAAKSGEDLNVILEALGVTEVRQARALRDLALSGANLSDALNNATTAWRENSALTEEARKRFETTAAQLTILWNRIKDVGITIGNALLPVIKAMIGALEGVLPMVAGLADWFGRLPVGIQAVAVGLGVLAAAAGPVVLLFGQLLGGAADLVGAFKKGGIAATGLASAFSFLTNPITLVVLGLGALAAAIYTVATSETALEKELNSNTEAFKARAKALEDAERTYAELSRQQGLTEDQTRQLEDATRLLAEASGLTVKQFKAETEHSDDLTKAIREQIQGYKDLLEAKAGNLRAAQDAKLAELAEAQARLAAIKQGKATVMEASGEYGAVTERPMTVAERLEAVEAQTAKVQKLTHELAEASDAYNRFIGVQSDNAKASTAAAAATGAQTAATGKLAAELEAAAKAGKAHEKAVKDQAAALEALNKQARAMSVAGVYDKINEAAALLKLSAQYGGLAAEELEKYVKQIDAWIAAGYDVPPMLRKVWTENQNLLNTLPKVNESITEFRKTVTDSKPVTLAYAEDVKALEKAYEDLGKKIGGPDGVIDLVKKWRAVTLQPLPTRFVDDLAKAVQGIAANLGPNILRAFQGGGDVGKTIGASIFGDLGSAMGPALSKAIGGTLGKIAGSFLGPLGTMVGGALGGLVDKAFHRTAGRDLVTQFADSMGGFDALHAKLGALGDEGERLWVTLTQGVGRNNAKAAQAAIDQVTGALSRFEAEQSAMTAALDGARTKVGSLQSALQVFGGVVPASLRPTIDAMLSMSGIPDDIRAGLEGVAGDPSWQTMQSRAEALGINLRDLGPKFSEARISDIALGYVRDLTMFADAGADMTGVLRGMSDELSSMYQEAKATGAALPESIKPYMQSLIAMGLLLDENGEKVTDLNQVAFKEVEDKALKDVVNILKEIKDLLAKGLPAAASAGADDIRHTFEKGFTIPYSFEQQGAGPAAPELGVQGGTSGQFVDWAEGTAAAAAVEGAALAASQPVNITVVSQLDGREVARNQVKYIPRELGLAGI